MTETARLSRLRRRSEFLAAAKALYSARGAVLLQMRRRTDDAADVRVGFTATKKIGGAVQRNRAKRRLRALAQALLGEYGQPGCDYVLVARSGIIDRDYSLLLEDVTQALAQVHRSDASGLTQQPPRPPGARRQ